MKDITSLSNPYIKQLARLVQKSSQRRQDGHFVVEGVREILLAIEYGYTLETLYICTGILADADLQKLDAVGADAVSISVGVYQKIAYRKTTEGAIAVVKTKRHDLKSLAIDHQNALVLVIEAPEKPGNIGALLRTADAAKLDAVIIANPKTDMYNPNVIRNSLGAVFTVPIAEATSAEVLEYLKAHKYKTYATYLDHKSTDYRDVTYSGSIAIVIGTEDRGLDRMWLEQSSKNIIIPMQGKIDSINMSIATAIIVFEAIRQRR